MAGRKSEFERERVFIPVESQSGVAYYHSIYLFKKKRRPLKRKNKNAPANAKGHGKRKRLYPSVAHLRGLYKYGTLGILRVSGPRCLHHLPLDTISPGAFLA